MADSVKPVKSTSAAKSTDTSDTTSTAENTQTGVTNEPSASGTLPNTPDVDPTSGPQGAPSPFGENGRTGYTCGYCGQIIGAEGQHYNADGVQVSNPHPGTLVVADNWPETGRSADVEDEKTESTETK